MNEQLKSLTKLFSDVLFRIPDFQRGYAWTKKEVEEFWNDLIRLKTGRNHYVGVLTLEPVKSEKYSFWLDDQWLIESKNYKPYYIVDGQQRLTTSIILIAAIVDIMEKRNIDKLNYTTREKIIEKFIYEEKDLSSNKTFLFCYEQDNPSYSFLIKNIYCQSDLVTHAEYTLYNNNLYLAKTFFLKKLEQMSDNEIENVFRKISQNFLFNTYEISNDIDVYVSFETMNNRGKRLSRLELLKNRLIYISCMFSTSEKETLRLREKINICWKNIYYALGKNKDMPLNDDEFLDAHYHIYFSDIIYEYYKKRFDSAYSHLYHHECKVDYLLENYFVVEKIEDGKLQITDVFNYIEELNKYISIWTSINLPEESEYSIEIREYIEKIMYLVSNDYRNSNYFIQAEFYRTSYEKLLICAILAKEKNINTIKSFLKILEKYLFIRILFPYEVFYLEAEKISIEEFFYKYVTGELTVIDVKDKIDSYIHKILDGKTNQLKLIDHYARGGFYNKTATPYILWEYEKDLQKQSKNGESKIQKFKTIQEIYNSIEHIYPKEVTNNYWKERFKFGRKNTKVRNSIGNLLMVSQPKNSKLANKPFPEKCRNSNNNVGYAFGCYSEMEVAQNSDWTIVEIRERGIKIINFMKRRWDIKIDKKSYITFLGLESILE